MNILNDCTFVHVKQHYFRLVNNLILTALFLCLGTAVEAQSQPSSESSNVKDTYIHIPDSMLQARYPSDLVWRPELGIIREADIPKEWKFNIDSFLVRFATLPLKETYSELNYYYDDYVIHLGIEGGQRELERMRKAAKQYGSHRLKEETRFLEVFILYAIDWDEAINNGRKVAVQLEKEGKRLLAVRLKFDMLRKCNSVFDGLYHHAFNLAGELVDDLEKVTEEEFIYKKAAYFEMGHLYYGFRDYERAIPLLEKALTEEKHFFFDRSNLRARNTLAVYYQSVDSLTKSLYYYHSMLTSPDLVYSRAMYDAIAWANMGHIAAMTGNCHEADRLFNAALPVSISNNDHNFALGIMIGMGNCHLSTGEMEKARQIIDTAFVWMQDSEKYISPHRYRSLYPLIGKYHLRKGDIATFERYADSTAIAEKKYEEAFNARFILRAQSEIFEAKEAMNNEKIKAWRNYIIGITALLVLIAVIALITKINAQRLRRKNRSLFERLRDYDMQAKEINRLRTILQERSDTKPFPENETNGDDLYERLSLLLEDPAVFSDTKLTRKSIADLLLSNEKYLRETILQRTGLTFAEFIIGIRLNHARRLLLSSDCKYNQRGIALECGFGGISTFYRHFKNYYGMTPEQFRNSAKED